MPCRELLIATEAKINMPVILIIFRNRPRSRLRNQPKNHQRKIRRKNKKSISRPNFNCITLNYK